MQEKAGVKELKVLYDIKRVAQELYKLGMFKTNLHDFTFPKK